MIFEKDTNKLSVIEQIGNIDPDDVNYNRKTEDPNIRLNKFFFDLDEIDNQIAELEKRLSNLQQNKINSETMYNYLAYFDKYYDKFTDAEKKEFMHSFIERIDIFEEKQDDRRFSKSIGLSFRFGLTVDM